MHRKRQIQIQDSNRQAPAFLMEGGRFFVLKPELFLFREQIW